MPLVLETSLKSPRKNKPNTAQLIHITSDIEGLCFKIKAEKIKIITGYKKCMEVAAPEFIYLYEANKVILVRAKNIEEYKRTKKSSLFNFISIFENFE